jgi:acetoin:2,6-dichlorophenolindophenol oxidoreductase subunit beta
MLMSSQINTERTLAYVDALKEGVQQEMEDDDSVFVFGLDVDDHKFIQGSTRGLLEQFGPERVFTTPLSEDAMTGVAIGAAMAGMRPVHVHIRQDFLMLCMNQLVNIAAKSRYMYGGSVKVPLVVRSMIGKSWGQGAQHSQALYSMFMHVPGLKVIAPSNAYDAKGAMAAAIQDDNPVIFVEHRLLYSTEAYVPQERYTIEFGKARIVRSGSDITLLGISNMVMECMRTAELLGDIGISAEVLDPISLSPLDMDTIVASAQKTGKLLIVDNAWTACGASAEIMSQVVERVGPDSKLEIRRMGFAATPCPTTPVLEDHFYPNPATIGTMAHNMLQPDEKEWMPAAESTELAYQKQFKGPF